MRKSIAFILFIIFSTVLLNAQNLYVSVDGNDSNSGAFDKPFKSIPTAVSKITLGDTIYVRGGTYKISSTISITKAGTKDNMYFLFSYPGEKVLLDFSSQNFGTKGMQLNKAAYWHIKGLNFYRAGDNGMEITGASNNIIELCNFFENQDSGMQLSNGASDNKIINCDSYYNADPPDYGDADGFAPKLTVGSGNYFYGCRSWGNCDDGWDGYMRGANDVTTTLENCWTFSNGYLKDGTDPGSQANGNGFKIGGSDDKTLMHNFILKNCLSFDNKVKGFDQNNNKGSMSLYNCTGFRNGTYNFSIPSALNSGKTATIVNSVSLLSNGTSLNASVVQLNDSWVLGITVLSSDFISVDTTGVRKPRNSDGSLPDLNFMHLAQGSRLIDAGIDVGLPYSGSAPDLGAFEYGLVSGIVNDPSIPSDFKLDQNYPNPFNPSTKINFSITAEVNVRLDVFDMLGRKVTTLINENKNAGNYSVEFNAANLSSGMYFYRLNASGNIITKKMLFLK